jgi:CBS domain-containing protein
MATLIEQLTCDQPELITVSPYATLQEAVALMIEHDFSQLPIIEDGKPYGNPASFVTSTSIARALRYFGTPLKDLRVRDAVVPARTVSADEDLFSKMDDLLDAYAVLVLNPDGTIAGIVTNYDTTHYFRRRAEDMLLVEDIETTLKDHVRAAYGGDENDPDGPIQKAIDALSSFVDNIQDDCRKSFRRFCASKSIQVAEADVREIVDKPFAGTKGGRKFDDLTLNEYIQLARKEEAWKVLGPQFGISDKAFLEMLEGVRKTRNKLMHFRPDITPVERDNLRFCAQWFKNYPPLTLEEECGDIEDKIRAEIPPHDRQDMLVEVELKGIEEDISEGADNSTDAEPVQSKYAPLAAFLSKLPKSQERITLTFDQIEEIIKDQLPAAAREHRSWWANDSTTHVQSGQWLKVNWRVVTINMTGEKVVFARARDRERAYINFFSAVQNRLREYAAFPLHPTNPTGISWLVLISFPGRKSWLILSFALRQRLRLEYYIDTGNKEDNRRVFDALSVHRTLIEGEVGQALEWEPLQKKRASRIALYTEGSITDEPERLETLIEWAVENAVRFYNVISGLLPEVKEVLSRTSSA